MTESRRRRLPAWAAISLLVVVLAVAGLATLGLGGGDGDDKPGPRRTGPAGTVPVTRQNLVKSAVLAGELGYGPTRPITSTATGTVTWLPEVGVTIRRGQPLFRADDRPVVLLTGPLPMYRPLAAGVEGADVRQFETNLAALGYHGFTVDDEFSASTTTAVKQWQRDLKVPETGTVERGAVIYTVGPVRIARQVVTVGASATGEVLAYTGTTRMVAVSAGVAEAAWAAKGTKVTIQLPTGGKAAGQVASVGPPTTAAGAQGTPDAERPGTGQATVQVTITVADQKQLGGLSGGPVDISYVAQERKDVLTVPVNALLALAEGGYGVELTGSGGNRVVAVQVGLFAEGRVEVQGDGLTEGAQVGVPG